MSTESTRSLTQDTKRKETERQTIIPQKWLYPILRENIEGAIPDDAFIPAVDRLKTIRDHIVHANGHVVDGGKRTGLTEAIRTVKGFSVKRECIEVDKGTCEQVCRGTKQWFDRLMDACGPPYSRA